MQSAKTYFTEYCDYTGIHGFRYFTEKNRTIFERIWWLLTFVISLLFCILIIYETYQKWDENAIITTSSNKPVPIYEIPMPTITICPESKIPNLKFDNKILENVFDRSGDGVNLRGIEQNLTSNDKNKLEYLKIICDRVPKNNNIEILLNDSFFNKTGHLSDDFLQFIDEVKPHFDIEVLHPFNICAKFIPLLTDQGICYSYNILDRSDIFKQNVQHYKNFLKTNISKWSIDQGYPKSADYSTYPLRADTAFENTLKIEIRASSRDLDYGCKTASEGFRMVLHEPSSIPSLTNGYIKISLNQKTDVVVKPIVTIASDSVKKYSTEKRNCYFEDERRLTYFKKYTLSNCQMECRTNYTLAACDCVEFFMPRANGTRICRRDSRCSEKVKYLIQNDNILEKIESSVYENSASAKLKLERAKETLLNIQEVSRCGCLPTCSELSYKTDILQSALDFSKWDTSKPIITRGGFGNEYFVATLSFQFDASEFLPSERKELYGLTDFLANFGGLLGLFCGVSVLSFIEILYFLSIRMICNKKLFGRWTGNGEGSTVLPLVHSKSNDIHKVRL